MRNVLDKTVEKYKTLILYSVNFSENRAFCEIMSKNMVKPEGPQITSQYGAYALPTGLASLHVRPRTRVPTQTNT